MVEVLGRFSPYVYGNNNPVLMIDPDGMLATYNWDTKRYENEDGEEVGWDKVQKDYGLGKSGGDGEGNGNGGDSLAKVMFKKIMDFFGIGTPMPKSGEEAASYNDKRKGYEGFKTFVTDLDKAQDLTFGWVPYFSFQKETIKGNYKNASIAIAFDLVGGGSVRFGNDANQVSHAFRHTDELGLNRAEVQTAIWNHLMK